MSDIDENSQSFKTTRSPHVPENPVIQSVMRAPVHKQIGGMKIGGFKKSSEKITSYF